MTEPMDKTSTIANRNQVDSERLTKFLGEYDFEIVEQVETIAVEVGQPPWRVAIDIMESEVEIVFDLQNSTTLGRSYPNKGPYDGIDFSPFDAYAHGVSRNHALLALENGNVVISDLESMNGTGINGKRLQPNTKYLLHSGDIVYLGKLQLRFRFLHSPFIS